MSWKSVKVNKTENVITTAIRGESIGRVMFQKRCHEVAPSRVAASCRDGEMVCRPASRVIATKGMPRHTLVKITVARALFMSPRKLIGELMRPTLRSAHEMIENCAS